MLSQVMTLPTDRVRTGQEFFQNLVGGLGSSQEVLKISQVGSGRDVFKYLRSPGRIARTRLAGSDLIREKPWILETVVPFCALVVGTCFRKLERSPYLFGS